MFETKPFVELSVAHDRVRHFMITQTPFRVGSGSQCELRIQHPSLSDVHFTIDRSGDGWIADSSGHLTTLINGEVLSTQSLYPRDVIEIEDVVSLVFRDPVEEHRQAKARKEDLRHKKEKNAPTQDSDAFRRRYGMPIALLIVMSLLMGVMFLIVRDPDRGLPSLMMNTSASVAVALDGGKVAGPGETVSLASCILTAGQRGSLAAWERSGGTAYWVLADRYGGAATNESVIAEDVEYRALRDRIEQLMWQARLSETHKQPSHAREIYEQVMKIVPDSTCSIFVVAAARRNLIGGKS